MKQHELQILKIGSIVIGCIIAMAALIFAIQWTVVNDRIQRHYVSQKYHAAKIYNQKKILITHHLLSVLNFHLYLHHLFPN